jgi:hypothetical protein
MAEGLQPHRRLGDLRGADRRRPVRQYAAPQHPDAHPVANRLASPVYPRPAPLGLEPWHPLPCPVINSVRSTFAPDLSPGHHPAEGDSDSLPGANRDAYPGLPTVLVSSAAAAQATTRWSNSFGRSARVVTTTGFPVTRGRVMTEAQLADTLAVCVNQLINRAQALQHRRHTRSLTQAQPAPRCAQNSPHARHHDPSQRLPNSPFGPGQRIMGVRLEVIDMRLIAHHFRSGSAHLFMKLPSRDRIWLKEQVPAFRR